MVFEIQQLSKKVPLFRKSMNSTLNRFPKGKFQIHKSRPVFTIVIFLAIFSDINAVDAKAMRKASNINELYFLPLILAKFMEGKKWIVFDKIYLFKPEFPTDERSLDVKLEKLYATHIFSQSINSASKQTTRKI